MERANWIETKTLDDSTRASDPVFIGLSDTKLCQLHPELYQQNITKNLFHVFKFWKDSHKEYIPTYPALNVHYTEHLLCGDSRAAMVISINPLLVAAYTDEFDCVAMLKFPDRLITEYSLKVYDRLLTVNLYERGDNLVEDLEHGASSYYRYSNFIPFIAEFLSDNLSQIELRKSQILAYEWERTKYLAEQYISKNGKRRVRDGRPLWCKKTAQIDKDPSI